MVRVPLLADGTRVSADDLVCMGTGAFVFRQADLVLKAPRLLRYLDADGIIREADGSWLYVDSLESEKRVYERLHHVPGIAECISCSTNGILLKYYASGSLSDHMMSHGPPPMASRWKWILQATDAVKNCHDRGVLVFDIALRNLVLADDMTLRMIDFAQSAILPSDSNEDISKADLDGCTVMLDIFHLANVIYSLLTWQDFHSTCAFESELPALDDLPRVEGVENGHLVRDCWMKKYATVHKLQLDLDSCSIISIT